MRAQFDNQMPLARREGNHLLLCFDEQKVESDGKTRYTYETARVAFPPKYGEVVSDIINDHYTSDEMQAIINNHLMESESEEHHAEFVAMQEWRAKAKEIARRVIDNDN